MGFFGMGSTLIDVHTLPGKLALARFSVQQTEGLKVGCGEMRGWVSGGMGGWVGGGMGLRVGFININDMYNNDVGQESAQKIMKQTGDLKAATFYFAS